PAPPALKCPGDFAQAWGGIASLEVSLAATWTSLNAETSDFRLQSSNFKLQTSELCLLARLMSEAPAALAGLSARKGRISVGSDADLMIWDPDAEMTVDPMRLHQRHKLTPYAGRRLRGVVKTTLLGGEPVWDGARVETGGGRLL